MNRAPGELPMPDLTPPGAAHAARFARGIRREIIMQQEMRAILAFKRVDDLLVLAGAQGRDHDRLRLAAGEERRAMRAWQHADLDRDRPDRLGVAPIDTRLAVENGATHDVFLELLEAFAGERA